MLIMLFLLFIFYDKQQSEKTHIRNQIFLEMQSYSLGLKNNRFKTKIIPKKNHKKLYTLYEEKKNLYILAPLTDSEKKEMMMVLTPMGNVMIPYSSDTKEVQKVTYPQKAYKNQIKQMQYHYFLQLLLFALGAMILSLLAAWYTLNPLRSSLRLLEDFIKDIIHDLNTPLTSILLNLKMIETKNDEIESIRTATQTIEMLHHNLDAYLREQKQGKQHFTANEIVEHYVNFFTPMYDYLEWKVHMHNLTLFTDKQAFERIIYNLLSNACKYNISNGKIEISIEGTLLRIQNSSYGVRHPQKVFERFYKESERGLGIGLHIVNKLCQNLNIEKNFIVEGTDIIVTLECKHIIMSS